jgi:hypothetical protein
MYSVRSQILQHALITESDIYNVLPRQILKEIRFEILAGILRSILQSNLRNSLERDFKVIDSITGRISSLDQAIKDYSLVI